MLAYCTAMNRYVKEEFSLSLVVRNTVSEVIASSRSWRASLLPRMFLRCDLIAVAWEIVEERFLGLKTLARISVRQ